jgi:cell division protein FtsX
MKMTFVKVLVVLVLCVVGIGFYRGWFALSSPARDTASNKVNISLSMDGDKVKEDAETVKDKTSELTGMASEGVKELGDQARDKVKSE